MFKACSTLIVSTLLGASLAACSDYRVAVVPAKEPAPVMSEASVEKIPTITAIGYAVVSSQPGKSVAQRRLMAIRAARMAASLMIAAKSAPTRPRVSFANDERSTSEPRATFRA